MYEIKHFTLCDGWVNTWSVVDGDGNEAPETFATFADAQAALDAFFEDVDADMVRGERETEEGYGRDEFVIVRTGKELGAPAEPVEAVEGISALEILQSSAYGFAMGMLLSFLIMTVFLTYWE